MSVQARLDNNNTPFIRGGAAPCKQAAVIKQDAGRAVPLAPYTLLGKVAADGKYTPFINEVATDGTALPSGIYLGPSIPAADLVAGDIPDCHILIGEAFFDLNQLIIENSKLLTTVIGAATVEARTVEDELARRGLYPEDTVDISSYET